MRFITGFIRLQTTNSNISKVINGCTYDPFCNKKMAEHFQFQIGDPFCLCGLGLSWHSLNKTLTRFLLYYRTHSFFLYYK